MLYPLKMRPAFKDYLWGGTRLRDEYGKKTELTPVAESWEISCHPDGPSVIDNGPLAGKELRAVLAENPGWMGTDWEGAKSAEFPLLVKLIDAKERLSIQVHPDDAYARREERQQGKNEMWYVMDALPDAELILGLSKPAGRDELRERIERGTLMEILNRVPVKAGDCFEIPAGLIHAIGAGVLVAEIQQNSNVTYRVYDYDRRGADGKPRPLHVERALDVIDPALAARSPAKAEGELLRLTDWPYFSTGLARVERGSPVSFLFGGKSCHCLLVTAGQVAVGDTALGKGESAFLPAGMGAYTLTGRGEALVTSI